MLLPTIQIVTTSAHSSGIKDWSFANDEEIRKVMGKGPCRADETAARHGNNLHYWDYTSVAPGYCTYCKAKAEWNKRNPHDKR